MPLRDDTQPRFSHARRGSVRSRGLLAALALVAIFGSVVGLVAMRQGKREHLDPLITPEPPPDVTQIPAGGSMAQGLVQGNEMHVQLVDAKDPSRVEAEISADRSQPLANSEFSLTKPRARIYFRDGRTMLIDAAKGRARMPQGIAGGRPQDGLLEGNVTIRLYAPTPGHRILPGDAPLLTATGPTLKFDATLGRLEFPAGVRANSDQLDFEGEGLVVQYDQIKKRIDGLHLDRLQRLVLVPQGKPRPATALQPPVTGTAAAPASPTFGVTPAALPPTESLYRMLARERVSVRQGTRSIAADEMLAWLRLVDGKVRPGALAALPSPPARSAPHAALVAFQPVGPAVKVPRPPKTQNDSEPIEIHWSGPMDAALESSTPVELSRNDVFVRFTSPTPLGAIATDSESRSSALGSLIEYGATVREASVAGPGAEGAWLHAQDRGEARGARFEIALSTGRVRSPGPGVMRGSQGNGARAQLAWATDGEFLLAMERGVIQPRPVSAKMTGDVRATDGSATVRAESLDASFFANTSALAHVQMVGAARADDGKPGLQAGRMSADALDLTFVPLPGGASRASRLDLNGHAQASQRDQSLSANRIIADLAPDDAGQTTMTALVATQDVSFLGKGGTTISGDTLSAAPAREWAEVTSKAPDGVRLCQGLSTILTSHAQFDGRGRVLHVPAPGRLTHQRPGADAPASELELTWAERLDYDDSTGMGRCDGATMAVLIQPGVSLDTLRSESAEIRLAPTADAGKRVLESAVAIGSTEHPARAESRRFASGGTTVERITYVEGARVEVSQSTGVFEVPVAGKLLFADRRPQAGPERDAPSPAPGLTLGANSARGDTLLSWNGTMRYQRGDGRVHATDTVRAIHIDASGQAQLECDDLLAFVETQAGGQTPVGELVSALASGRAWLRSQGRELAAGQVSYDARSSVAQAEASIGGPVTISDPKTGVPLKARRVVWFLKGDRVEAEGIDQIATPR